MCYGLLNCIMLWNPLPKQDAGMTLINKFSCISHPVNLLFNLNCLVVLHLCWIQTSNRGHDSNVAFAHLSSPDLDFLIYMLALLGCS